MSKLTVVAEVSVKPEQAARIEELLKPSDGRFVNGLNNLEGPELAETLAQADVMFVRQFRSENIKAAPQLKWLHFPWVGINMALADPNIRGSQAIITNGAGIIGAVVADQTMAFILAFARQLPYLHEAQKRKEWNQQSVVGKADTLEDKTVGIIGYGNIGTDIGKRCKGFGMRVIATRTNPDAPSEYADDVLSNEQLPELLAQSDYVVVTAPLTEQTRGMLGKKEFKLMKPTAVLINIARGQLIKEAEMIEALRDGTIAGAGLDVFEKEPLPTELPLWEMENVIVTPHSGGVFEKLEENSFNFFAKQLERYLKGEKLKNIVDKQRGY